MLNEYKYMNGKCTNKNVTGEQVAGQSRRRQEDKVSRSIKERNGMGRRIETGVKIRLDFNRNALSNSIKVLKLSKDLKGIVIRSWGERKGSGYLGKELNESFLGLEKRE